jgi:hypothetical protein
MNDINTRFVFLTMKDLEKLTSRKSPTIYRWISGGLFPKPVHPYLPAVQYGVNLIMKPGQNPLKLADDLR